jgi:hydrogenase nickel incorporation protein HypA/HybF
MHEFSLAVEVIHLAEREAEKAMAKTIEEITIEIGDLSGIEANAFESALGLLVKDSVLVNAHINIIKIPGKGRCNSCDFEFEMTQMMVTCPKCNAFPSEISGGQQFRVQSLVVE